LLKPVSSINVRWYSPPLPKAVEEETVAAGMTVGLLPASTETVSSDTESIEFAALGKGEEG
jgi:hypothetical protein